MSKVRKRRILWLSVGALLIIGGIPLYRVIHQRYCNQALIAAIQSGDRNAVRDLLASGADPSVRIPLYRIDASPRAHVMRLFRRLEAKETPDVPLEAPALCAGIEQINGTDVFDVPPEDPIIIEMLLSHGADIDSVDCFGQTALGWAVSLNRMHTARLLLEHGANPHCSMQFTHSMKIAMSGKRERVLLEGRFRASLFQGALDRSWLGQHDTSPEIVRLLVLYGAVGDAKGRTELTPLMVAAFKGDLNAVQALLKGGGEVNARIRGNTALGWITACTPRSGDQEIERLLVRAGGVR